MTQTPDLAEILAPYPATRAIVETVVAAWPKHAAYLAKSFRPRPEAMLAATEAAASAALRLADDKLARFAEDYRWTCEQLNQEELFFHRNGRYRLSTFAEAYAEVYSDAAYMGRYVNGLLLSQVLWYNHAASFAMFAGDVLAASAEPFDYLEVGPGHGLMTYLAAQSPMSRSLEAWDVSPVSIAETRHALDRLGVAKPVALTVVDILKAEIPERRFDLVVISEVLEHLERPEAALATLRACIRDGGRLYVNVPINSPSPDHIYLFSDPAQVRALVEAAGFEIEAMELFPMQAYPLEKALASMVSISAGVIARPAGAAR